VIEKKNTQPPEFFFFLKLSLVSRNASGDFVRNGYRQLPVSDVTKKPGKAEASPGGVSVSMIVQATVSP